MSDQSAPQEIVIVRRRGGGEEEGHHGGVWKIAYADFMTAMMAFFLVMWLVNAADKKVLTQVASYFNPLKMSDRVTASKGVEDMVEGAQQRGQGKISGSKEAAEEAADTGKSEKRSEKEAEATDSHEDKKGHAEEEAEKESKAKKAAAASTGQTHLTEQELFNDPYGILEKLASQAVVGSKGGSEANTGTGSETAGGEAFRDPFDPDFSRSSTAKAKLSGTPPVDLKAVADAVQPEALPPVEQATPGKPSEAPMKGTDQSVKGADLASVTETLKPGSSEGKPQSSAKDLQVKLEEVLKSFAPGQHPAISVKETPEGLLISLTDEFDFEMFKVSSSEPNPQLVAAMKKVAQVLKEKTGALVVRGHTDGRPFKKGTSDNWRLSTQRALMSRYMLIAGGVEEKRVERVEGYADTALKVTADPLAAQNRRIEILLRKAEVK
jgi:chemotaxis protein MotB